MYFNQKAFVRKNEFKELVKRVKPGKDK